MKLNWNFYVWVLFVNYDNEEEVTRWHINFTFHDEDKEKIDKTGLLPLPSFSIKGCQIYRVDGFIR